MAYHRLSDVDTDLRTAQCSECGPVKIKKSGKYWRCNVRYKSYPANQGSLGSRANSKLRDELLAAQGGVCALCGRLSDRWCLDHDHDNEMVRGVLCYSCNVGIGQFGDDPDRLMQAMDYLIVWRAKHASSNYPRYRK